MKEGKRDVWQKRREKVEKKRDCEQSEALFAFIPGSHGHHPEGSLRALLGLEAGRRPSLLECFRAL
jgi:hypothetical protein